MGYVSKILSAAAVAVALAYPAAAHHKGRDGDHKIKITGCVVKSDYRGSGGKALVVWGPGDFMLSSVLVESVTSNDPAAVGTSGAGRTVFYWLDDEDDVAKHAGRSVEITGEIEDDIEKGELEIDRKGDLTEVEFKADGKKVKVRVPTAMLFNPDGATVKDAEYDVVLHKVDVDKVRVLSSSCAI